MENHAESNTDFSGIRAMIVEQGKAFAAFKEEQSAALDEQAIKIAALTVGPQDARTEKPEAPGFKAMKNFMRSGARSELTGQSDPDGGYAVPKEVDQTINDQLISLSPMRSIARVVTTATRDFHTLVGARGATSGWVGEEDPRTTTNTPELVDIAPPSGEVYAYPSATNWLLDDAGFKLEDWLRDNVATEIAIQEGIAFLSGNGTNKPQGLLTYIGTGAHPLGEIITVPSGAATGVKGDNLIDLVYSLPAPYRLGAVFLMNSKTAGEIRKLKDGNGNYIWQPALVLGQPDRLLGYPVVIDEAMPDVGAGKLAVAFGNFKRGYLITDRLGMTVIRDQVTKPGWTKFYFAKRVGGAVTDSNAIRLLRIAAS